MTLDMVAQHFYTNSCVITRIDYYNISQKLIYAYNASKEVECLKEKFPDYQELLNIRYTI